MLSLTRICQICVLLVLFTTIQAVIVPEPIALYPLNSKYGTQEIKNRQPQGNAVGVSLAPGPDGKPGGSYQFVGNANSYIEFPNNGGLDVQRSITMLCWIYPQNTDGPLFNYYTPSMWTWGTHMWMVWGKLFARHTHRNYQFTPHLISSQPLALNQWHYVGTSYDYNTGIARLCLNGQKTVELNIGSMTLSTQDNVRMGAKADDGRYFKGRIPAMQVYDVALTAEQINEVRDAGRVDICEEQKPCKNGAGCESSGDSYICKCAEGFQGPTCEEDVNECEVLDPCQNGAECRDTFGSYECICKPGFTGKNCETDIDDCAVNSVVCYNGGTCVDQVNGYTCDCQPGYIGEHCEWESQGCYKEVKSKKNQAMGKIYAKVRKYKKNIQEAVEACLKKADEGQLQIFGVKSKFKCTTTKGSADFKRHGVSKNCKKDGSYGVGAKKANFVYILKKEA